MRYVRWIFLTVWELFTYARLCVTESQKGIPFQHCDKACYIVIPVRAGYEKHTKLVEIVIFSPFFVCK